MFVDRNLVQRMKDQYPPGTRIELDYMGDDPRPIAPGTKGTVRIVDDMGTVHCDFDNGRRLGLIPGEDSFHAPTQLLYVVGLTLVHYGFVLGFYWVYRGIRKLMAHLKIAAAA